MNASTPIWSAAEAAIVAGDRATLDRLLRENQTLFSTEPPQSSWLGGLAPNYSGGDARAILTREHHFESFEQLAEHLAWLQETGSPEARFEAAVDAIVAGDLPALEQQLRADAGLIRARSTRVHRSTLLHYVGANGVEGWRQRTPPNAVEIAECLLAAGSEVDAMAAMYGGSTTLGLVATSIHPLQAGVQNALIDVFLKHGATIDHPQSAGNAQSIVPGCLANGRPQAAAHLANRGARLDLEGAAGVGRLETVRRFFGDDGRLTAGATPAQMKSGFQWACEYGHTNVVDFLLQHGIAVGEIHRGQTGLHWAAYGGHPDIVKLLLEHGAPVDLKDEQWQNTPLGWALYGWTTSTESAGRARFYEVAARLVAAGSIVKPESMADENVLADPLMQAALKGVT